MRVVQVLPELREGGVERGVVELSREFVARGVESWVISRGGPLVARIEADGGRHVRLDVCSKNPLTAIWRAGKLRKALRAIDPDIVHARSRVPAWLCRIGNRWPRRPFVTTVHGLNSISRYSRVMVTGDRVIAVGEPVREHVSKAYGLAEGRVRVIPRGVDMRVFNREGIDDSCIGTFCAEHGLEDAYVVTSVGRVTWLKDYESFIRAVASLAPSMPDLRGVIVGGVHPDKRAYFEGLRSLAAELGIEDRVVFTGGQAKMPEIYALSDLVVNASLKMGNVGRTVVEALATGTPVIATTYPGLANLVVDGVNGRIINNQDPEGIADAVAALRAEPPEGVRATVPAAYTLDAMTDAVLGVYEDLLRERRGRIDRGEPGGQDGR